MTAEAMQASTYEVLRKRLRDGAEELRRRFGLLNVERSKVFGNLETRLLSTVHVTTEHNCVPRDLFSIGGHVLLGYNVQFGLKTEIAPSDVFSLYRLEGEQAAQEPLAHWMDDRFGRDFAELMRYYKHAAFSSFFQNGPLIYMVFQVGKTSKDIKAFKWAIDGQGLRYLDNRSEQEIRYPDQHAFRWVRATREQHRSGVHPHVSIGDLIFVECVGGDLTIKIEDNTSSGSGIYSEPVENLDQTLDDAEIYHCILGNLVLLKVRPYQEKEFRHFIYSTKRRQAMRLDAMKQACTQLPDDHGIIFPGGVFLQTGNYKLFDHGLTDVQFQRTIAAPNGEDYLYQFFQPDSGTYLQLRYNLIRQDVDIPLVCHGQSFFDDGRMITMRVHETPQKHHALQLWQTPFVGPDFKVPIVAESMLYKIGNRDLVRCMSECQEILQLIDKDESYGDLYADIEKRATDILDGYFWIDREETYQLSVPLRTIHDAATAAVDEYDKVVRVRNETAAALAQAQTATSELLRAADHSRFESIAEFVTMLRNLRAQRGHVAGLRELRYIDSDAVGQLETDLEAAAERIGQRCVQFLLSESALEPYRKRLAEAWAKVSQVSVVAAGRELQNELASIAVDLELLVETVSQLKIDDLTHRTAIVDRTGDLLAELNRAKSELKARVRSLLSTEMEADFASQSKLLDQSSAGMLDSADQPEKVDEALSRMMLHIEELEGRFAEHDGLLERLNEKRETLIAAFEARRQQLVEIRSRRADGLVKAAERVLAGVASRAGRIEDADALRAYFAADPMVDKVRKIAGQLGELGDNVRMEDVLGRLKSLSDDAQRQQRDRHDLFVDGADRIRLGHHVFAVNQQAVELTTVVRDGGLHMHLTGTQFYSPLSAPELEQSRDLWLQSYASETPTVYRAETLAFQTLEQWRRGERVAQWRPEDYQQATPEQRVTWLRQWMQTQHTGGYSRGVHDHDAVHLLDHLLKLQSGLGLLRFSPATRAVGWYAWQRLVPADHREATEKWLRSYGTVASLLDVEHRTDAYRRQVAEHLSEHAREFLRPVLLREAAAYVFEQILSGSDQPVVSPRAVHALKHLRNQFSESARASIQASLAAHRSDPWQLWQLGISIVDASLATMKRDDHEELDPLIGYRLELTRLMVSHDDPFALSQQSAHSSDRSATAANGAAKRHRSPDSGDKKHASAEGSNGCEAACYVTGLHGDHPTIAGGKLRLHYHDFTERLTHHAKRVMPRFEALQAKKRELLHASERTLRTHEFKARVLTSFVRNRLIDEVYLPLIGENLAKQLGAAGENKRTDRMGMLLLISPPGYGKTTLMEYIANRLGLVFVKINGPALGHHIRSLDPAEATNASAREEVNRINLALEMGDNVMLVLDDIQHCHPELLQKFIPLCDATRRIEGVWQGQPKTYDLRGRKVAVVMAGNPYTESGQRFQIPDMLANRADVYNLGEIIGDKREAFEQSYIENCLTSNASLLPLARAARADQLALIAAAERDGSDLPDLSANFSADQAAEMMSVLKKLVKVRNVILRVNRQYIQSAAQADAYRTEPPFKLQGSYRNMNRIAEKVAAVMNENELMTLIVSAYEQDAQTLTRDSESNLLKFRELLGIMTPAERERWEQICYAYVESTRLGSMAGDDQALQVLKSLASIRDGLETIRRAIHTATDLASQASQTEALRGELSGLSGKLGDMGSQLLEQLKSASSVLERSATTLPEQKVIVQHSVPRSMTELVRSQYQLLYDGLKHLLEESSSQSAAFTRLRESFADCLAQYAHLQSEIDSAEQSLTPAPATEAK